MPSNALLAWQTQRIPRLQNVEADCVHLETLHAPVPNRVQLYIRAYAVLLSAEFQGFCRELHSECTECLVDSVLPLDLRAVFLLQCSYGRKLETGNPNSGNLGADFNRFGMNFWPEVLALHPGHAARQHRLAMLNAWRNAIAHDNFDAAELGGTVVLTIPQVRDWRMDCDAFGNAFDVVVRNFLQTTLGTPPWSP